MKDPIDLEENPAYQLWLATNAWHRQIRRVLEPIGLTHVQFTVLGSIWRLGAEGDSVTQADVCRFGSLDPNMVSEVVKSLERKKFLTKLPHPTDRRANQLILTPEGTKILSLARQSVTPVTVDFFAPLGEERRELARMLGLIARQAPTE